MIQRPRKYMTGPGLGSMLIKATIGSAGLRIAGMFFAFLVGVQLARGLGVEGYGIYGLAMSIIALLTVLTEFGLPQLLAREVAAAQVNKDWGRLCGILKWSSNIVLLVSVAIMITVAVWLLATDRDLDSPLSMTLLVGLVMLPVVAHGKLRSATLLGLQHILKGQVPDILIRPASYSLLLFLVPMLTFPLQPALAMGLGVVSASISLALAAILLRRHLPHEIRNVAPRMQSRTWWSSALPMALTEGMRGLQGHLVIFLLGFMATVDVVGIFRVASSMAMLVTVPFTLLNVVGAPVIARLHAQGDHTRSQRLLSWIALGMVGSTLALSLPFFVAGEPLLSFVFGEEFVDANVVLQVMCGSAIINGFFGANAVLLNMSGHHSRVTHASAVSIALLALTAPPMIAMQGAIGAAFATALSTLTWKILMWRNAQRLLALDSSFLSFFKVSKKHI